MFFKLWVPKYSYLYLFVETKIICFSFIGIIALTDLLQLFLSSRISVIVRTGALIIWKKHGRDKVLILQALKHVPNFIVQITVKCSLRANSVGLIPGSKAHA